DCTNHELPRQDWIEIPVPALISEETFALAQEQLEQNRRHSPRRTLEPSLLQGMLVCERYGYALYRTSTRTSARKLGIPSVLDRFIQQAVMQVLQSRWDRTFSEHSYGFRPGRSAQQYITAGYRWVVDLDLEKFFDRVNHDQLMAKIAERVSDKRLLKLIRAFLRAGVMEGGLVS